MPDVFVSPEDKQPEHKPKEVEVRHSIPGYKHNSLSSFCLYPEGIGFETKNDDEKIILMLRQHPVVNFKWILTAFLLATGPTVLNLFGIFALLPIGFPLVITLSWYLVTSAYAIEGFLDWYFNVYFITTERIVDVDFYNLIDKRVSNAEIEKIEDVSYTMGGVLRTLLNYGDIFIQTAAEVSEFDFYAVPNPEKAVKILDDLRSKT